VRSGRATMLLAAGGPAVTYVTVVRPRQLTWGATPVEVSRLLPGDDLVRRPTFKRHAGDQHLGTTRGGVAVADPGGHYAGRVVQLRPAGQPGPPERPTDHPGAARVVTGRRRPDEPGWDERPGSPFGRPAPHDDLGHTRRHLLLWRLEPGPAGTTRLVTRIRSRTRWSPMSIAFAGLKEVADFWMIRTMLLNLRKRAEALPVTVPASETPAVASSRSVRGAGHSLAGQEGRWKDTDALRPVRAGPRPLASRGRRRRPSSETDPALAAEGDQP
jgi:hypothetical protein